MNKMRLKSIFLFVFVGIVLAGGVLAQQCRECNLKTAGDANNDCEIDIADASHILDKLFVGNVDFCNDASYYVAADFDGNKIIDITDAVNLMEFLFIGGGGPALLNVESKCVDSDGGLESGVFGMVNITNKTGIFQFNDSCINFDKEVLEMTCDGNKLGIDNIPCENGCEDGACVGVDIPDMPGGRILEVRTIRNSSADTDDTITFEDIQTGEVFIVVVSSEGFGFVDIGGFTHKVRYSDNPNIENDENVEIESNLGVPAEGRINLQRVFKYSFIIMGDPDWNGKILKVNTIRNSSADTDDTITFDDRKGSRYRAVVTSEGSGILGVDGVSYSIKYFDNINIENDENVEVSVGNLKSSQRVYKKSFIVLPEVVDMPAGECNITGASWNKTEAVIGNLVGLVVEGTNCNGESVSFEVREEDGLLEGLIDDPVGTNPVNGEFVNGKAKSVWIVEDRADGLLGASDPEYYFIARVVGSLEVERKSNLLRVVEREEKTLKEDTTSLPLDLANSVLSALGENGIAWYCGEIDTITDGVGNVYGVEKRDELRNVLGHSEEICGSGVLFSPSSTYDKFISIINRNPGFWLCGSGSLRDGNGKTISSTQRNRFMKLIDPDRVERDNYCGGKEEPSSTPTSTPEDTPPPTNTPSPEETPSESPTGSPSY